MADNVKIGELAVRNDSTIGAASQGSLCQLATVDPDTISGQQTANNSTLVRITFPTEVADDDDDTDKQAQTCATFNPDPSVNGMSFRLVFVSDVSLQLPCSRSCAAQSKPLP